MGAAVTARRPFRFNEPVPPPPGTVEADAPRAYAIFTADGASRFVRDFTASAEPDGRSADEQAIGELIEYSRAVSGSYVVLLVPADGDPVVLAGACEGVGYYTVDPDAAAADSMHGTQLSADERDHWRTMHATRRGLGPDAWAV